MEIVSSTTYYAKLKRYWRRRRYQRRINGSSAGNKRKLSVIRLGGHSPRRRWKIRPAAVKLRLKLLSPIRLVAKLHDAYIRTMIRFAGKFSSSNGMDIFGGKRVPKGRQAPMIVTSGKEVLDPKLVMEIYKTMVDARHQLVIL